MAGERRVVVARAQLRLALAGAQQEAHMPRALLGARAKALAVQAPAVPLVLLPPVAEPK